MRLSSRSPLRKITYVALFSAVILGSLWLLIPTTDIVAPDWEVFVTDVEGKAISNATVTVFSQQYTLESRATERTEATDETGYAHFDQRKIRAAEAFRVLGAIRSLAQRAHASFGVHTHIAVFKEGYGEPSKLALFAQNDRQERANGEAAKKSHLILQKCPQGYSGFGCAFPENPDLPMLPLQR